MAKKALLEKEAYDGLLKSGNKVVSDIPLNAAKSSRWSGHAIPSFPNPDSTGLFFDSGSDYWIVIATFKRRKLLLRNSPSCQLRTS